MSYIVNLGVTNLCRPDQAYYTRRRPMDVKFYYAVKAIRYLSDSMLLIALGIGLYSRWVVTNDVTIACLGMMSCFIFPIALAFNYYFSMEHISLILYSLWVGALMGVNALLPEITYLPPFTLPGSLAAGPGLGENNVEVNTIAANQLADGLLLIHLILLVAWILTERLTGLAKFDNKLLHESELFTMLGFGVAGLMTENFTGFVMFLFCLGVTISAIRMKSYWSLVNLACLLAISTDSFFPALHIKPNNMLIIVFITNLVSAPIMDLYFNPSSVFDRWLTFFKIRHFFRILIVVALAGLQLVFIVYCGNLVFSGEHLYITGPGFVVFGLLWLCFHCIYLMTMWNLMGRITECMPHISKLDENVAARLSKVMASKGMRYFCIVSQRLVIVAVITTGCLGSVAWQKDTTYIALFLSILPIELLTLSLVNELSVAVGGTCVGYALIAPNSLYRSDGSAMPLPQNHIQDLNIRSTELLVSIQNFFRDHLIDMYGCDYSINGLEPQMLENKIKALFGSNTTDGLKYDSYILYFSGHTYQNGDWAMSDGSAVSLDKIIQWWKEKVDDKSSRLIIMVDSLNGYQWGKHVKRSKNVCIGLQTLYLSDRKKRDVDLIVKTGEFTREWIQFNSTSEAKDINGLRIPEFSKYYVSYYWSDYHFKMPSDSDIMTHSQLHFPKFTWPFIKIVSCPYWSLNWFFCEPLFNCARRIKMKWLPPKILDTGHGFYFMSAY